MKKLTVCLAIFLILLSVSMTAQAEENSYKGDFLGLVGNESLLQNSYQFTDKLQINSDMQRLSKRLRNDPDDYFFRTDLHYQILDWLGAKIGGRYDSVTSETIPYAGLDFYMPFFGSNNLKVLGYYNHDYEGKDWTNYEFAWRIQMYEHLFIDAGVRGDGGDGFKPYVYNKDNDPLFFIRADFSRQWGKFGVEIRPMLFVSGDALTDSTFKYSLSDRSTIVLNFGDFYDREMKYRLGLEYKF